MLERTKQRKKPEVVGVPQQGQNLEQTPVSRSRPPQLDDSWFAILTACLQYVMSDITKKWKSFMMGVLAVFLTVSFITFLTGVSALGPLATIKNSLQ